MAFDESLYVTAKFTTAKGLSLSKQSNALTIKDTSIPITYTAGFFTNNLATTPMSSVDEGGTAYIVLITTGVPDFTYLDWEITGAGITLDDTGASTMSGRAMVRNNIYWATIKPKLDRLTEGNETLTITFKRDGVVVASASIVINDTSTKPTIQSIEIISVQGYDRFWDNSLGAISITLDNIPDGTQLDYIFSGSWVTLAGSRAMIYTYYASSVTIPLSGKITINNNKCYFTFRLNDTVVTTTSDLKFTVYYQGVELGSATRTIYATWDGTFG